MIQKLAKLGKLVPEEMFPANLLGLELDYETDDVVFLNFNCKGDSWLFDGVSVEEFSKSKADKYLVKTKGGNYTPDFPSFPVYSIDDLSVGEEINFEKSKVGKRVIRCLKRYKKDKFEGVIEELLSNSELKSELEFKAKDFSDFLLSFKFDSKYVGDSKWIADKKETLKKSSGKKDYFTFNGKKYEASDKLCSVTAEKHNTIWGYVSPYKFYAVKTELGAVPGGFNAKEAWKNFPVSPEGAKYLERGQKFVEEYLSFRFCGIPYFIIPERILNQGNGDDFISYIQDFKKFTLGKNEGSNDQLEEDLIALLAGQENSVKQKNSVNYTLFFYKPQNSEFKILATIEDVFPSYASKIFEDKKISEDNSIFKKLKLGDELIDLSFSFRHIKQFVPETKAFLEIVRAVFMQKQVDFNYLLGRIMNKMQVDFANNKYLKLTLLQAVLILKLFHRLKLIEQTKTSDKLIMNNKYETFFNEHTSFFNDDSATKKTVFLEGVLVQKLLNIQYRDRKATPFRSRLHSLKLKEKYIKRLLTETIEKLEQYDKNYYRKLEETISKYLLNSRFEISDDEISFYFTMGMNLADEFKTNEVEQRTEKSNT
jgi:CRISPR-associated protein Csh1